MLVLKLIESTLMDVLSGRTRTGSVAGDIRFNGHPTDPLWRREIVYVQQQDLFLETMTCREILVGLSVVPSYNRIRAPANMLTRSHSLLLL